MSNIKENDVLTNIKKLIESDINYEEDVLDLVDVVPDNNSVEYFKFSSRPPIQKELSSSEKGSEGVSSSLKELKEVIKTIKQTKKEGSTSIEDLVINILRPEIKKWLEINLPSLANEVITSEIKKIIHEDN